MGVEGTAREGRIAISFVASAATQSNSVQCDAILHQALGFCVQTGLGLTQLGQPSTS